MPNPTKDPRRIKRRRRQEDVKGKINDPCDHRNNYQLMKICKARKDLKNITNIICKITGYSRATVTAWKAPKARGKNSPNPAFRAMPGAPLRLIKLEFGMATPRYSTKLSGAVKKGA